MLNKNIFVACDTNSVKKLEEWIENGKDYPDIMRKFNRYLEKKEKTIRIYFQHASFLIAT